MVQCAPYAIRMHSCRRHCTDIAPADETGHSRRRHESPGVGGITSCYETGMIESLDVFEERLNTLDPDDDEFVLHVDELVEETSPTLLESIYPVAFRFFESHPEHDCGMPGTLVHVMEEYYPSYVDELVASISRTPSTNTVWMANRILNADIDDGLRGRLLQCLREAVERNDVSSFVQDEAKRYLERHT